ncbi:VOC family protein [Novosphingobium sp. Fuku2-ISO-50]|uniref:VOC family protein n=1 Tax=Novosphingobium sp. Fuku2-ISO-50 TaxID=1739114 RepID=UPI000A9C39B0|nr:VOC family protein [Novosphingobium sp. Fuku2-ISO-50]
MDIAALAYSVVTATDLESWVRLGEDIAGFSATRLPGGIALRLDDRAGRIFVEQGRDDCYAASGWEVRSRRAFDAAIDELAGHGVTVQPSTQDERALRHVIDMAWFTDPAGNRHELAYGYVSAFDRFVSPAGVPAFVTGDLGYGHAVLPAPNIAQTRDFLIDVMGFGLSDFMVHRPLGPGGPEMRIDFMHCGNARHHSLALFEGAVPAGCVHMMVEVPTLDEVGRAHDRMLKSGARLMATLGKHTNDHMTSFYIQTPGGFALEYGFGGLQVDWARHTEFEFTEVSLWGHDFSVGFGADEKAQLADAA